MPIDECRGRSSIGDGMGVVMLWSGRCGGSEVAVWNFGWTAARTGSWTAGHKFLKRRGDLALLHPAPCTAP